VFTLFVLRFRLCPSSFCIMHYAITPRPCIIWQMIFSPQVRSGGSARKSKRPRVGPTLLAILVGLTLTLVCQGHSRGSEHTGPHLTFLGELNHSLHAHAADTQSARASAGVDTDSSTLADMPGMDMSAVDTAGIDIPGTWISVAEQISILITPSPDTSTASS